MCRPVRMAVAWGVCLSVLVVCPVRAEVKLPAIIGDNMCLQQDMKDPVWGWASPDEKVTVTLGDQKQTATADKDGKWMVRLDLLKAGGPVEMTVAGTNTITVKNILIGEVWVCGGQSNMAMSVKSSKDADKEIPSANYPKIRLFMVAGASLDEPAKDCRGRWVECEPNTVGGFSAVGYFFGRDLHKVLSVPVGLIHSNVGGTPAEAWTSKAALEADPQLKPIFERYTQAVEAHPKALENWEKNKDKALARWAEDANKARADGRPVPRRPGPPGNPQAGNGRPACLFNGMIAPLIPYGVRGAIWYQGESNSGKAVEYRRLFPAMIADWRKQWGQGDFPFLFVQLANYMKRMDQPVDESWAWLREAQLMTLTASPKTGQAVIIDIGDAGDIHPKNKQDAGLRLSLAAQKIAYGKDVVFSGPIYRPGSMKVEADKAVLRFDHVGGGMVAKGDKLAGFAVAGEDRKIVWADATIAPSGSSGQAGDTITVSSKEVSKPVAVRYAWANNPECNLYNKEGLPASPFRTDDWPMATPEKK